MKTFSKVSTEAIIEHFVNFRSEIRNLALNSENEYIDKEKILEIIDKYRYVKFVYDNIEYLIDTEKN